jgi:hypothetical protein
MESSLKRVPVHAPHAALAVTYQKLLQRHHPTTSFEPADASLVVGPEAYQATWSVPRQKRGREHPLYHYLHCCFLLVERKTWSIAASISSTSEVS